MSTWLDEDLGSRQLPDPVTEGVATLDSVIQGFLANEGGFAPSEVNDYINRAIVNEAVEIRQEREHADTIASALRDRAEREELSGSFSDAKLLRDQADSVEEAAERAEDATAHEAAVSVARAVAESDVQLSADAVRELLSINSSGSVTEAFVEGTGKTLSELAPVEPAGHTLQGLSQARGIEVALQEAYGGASLRLRDRIGSGETVFEDRDVAMIVGAFSSPAVEAREAREGRDPATARALAQAREAITEIGEARVAEIRGASAAVDFSKGGEQPNRSTERPSRVQAPPRGPLVREPVHVGSALDEYLAQAGFDDEEEERDEVLTRVQEDIDAAFDMEAYAADNGQAGPRSPGE